MFTITQGRITIRWGLCKGLIVAIMMVSWVLIFTAIAAAEDPRFNQSIATFDELQFDFGTIDANGSVSHSFSFKNTGKDPLEIIHIQTSCGCTATEVSKAKIPQGETGTVMVTFQAKRGMGSQKKRIFVYTNSMISQEVVLTVFANVVDVIEVTPPKVSFQLAKDSFQKMEQELVFQLNPERFTDFQNLDGKLEPNRITFRLVQATVSNDLFEWVLMTDQAYEKILKISITPKMLQPKLTAEENEFDPIITGILKAEFEVQTQVGKNGQTKSMDTDSSKENPQETIKTTYILEIKLTCTMIP